MRLKILINKFSASRRRERCRVAIFGFTLLSVYATQFWHRHKQPFIYLVEHFTYVGYLLMGLTGFLKALLGGC